MRFQQMELNFLKLGSLLVIFLFSAVASAADYEPVDNLQKIVKDFVVKSTEVGADETINVIVQPLSAELAKCATTIVPSLPENSSRDQITGVELSCSGTPGWRTLAPVNVEVYTKVVVARQSILPRQTITDEDVELASFDKTHLYASFFKNKDEVVGQVAAHLLTPGTVLTKKNLQAPIIIRKNEIVSITTKYNSVSVTMQGIARSDGALNDPIKVYNPSSKRILDATVAGPNRAEIIA